MNLSGQSVRNEMNTLFASCVVCVVMYVAELVSIVIVFVVVADWSSCSLL